MSSYNDICLQSREIKKKREREYAAKSQYSTKITSQALNEVSTGRHFKSKDVDKLVDGLPPKIRSKVKEEKPHGSRWMKKYLPIVVIEEIFRICKDNGDIRNYKAAEIPEILEEKALFI